MSARKASNRDLPPLPDDTALIEAVAQIAAEYQRPTANRVAQRLGVQGASRAGHEAGGPQSWSGVMSPALRVAPRLRRLAVAGLLVRRYNNETYRHEYYPALSDRASVA